jgi:hypothetical protein
MPGRFVPFHRPERNENRTPRAVAAIAGSEGSASQVSPRGPVGGPIRIPGCIREHCLQGLVGVLAVVGCPQSFPKTSPGV